MIYLDHNATTPIAPEVVKAMIPYMEEKFGNPSSAYPLGVEAKEGLETARSQVASLLKCSPEEIVFTSGGTESNNMVIKSVAYTYREKGRHIITTAIEHPAVINPCLFLMNQGYEVTFGQVDSAGRVDPEDIRRAIRKDTILISVMHANNETGTVQPICEIGAIAREAGVLFHTDAAQSVGKIPTDVYELNVDFLSVAGHKVYAPKGIGALYIRKNIDLEPFMHGAGQESGRRAGTENVIFAVGLGAACVLAQNMMDTNTGKIQEMRDLLHKLLLNEIPELVLNGHPEKRLPNTLNVSFPGVSGRRLLQAVPGIYASTGAACHDQSELISHVLTAMNVPREVGEGAVRLTLGRENTRTQIETAAEQLISAYFRILPLPRKRASSDLGHGFPPSRE
nr:cysteine desulfurase [Desulfobacterales bacterium]